MMNLITDRTQADAERARVLKAKGWAAMTEEERAEWSAGLKGAYDYTNLNRVEAAVAELAGRLGLPLTVKTDWTDQDAPRSTELERYLGNVRALRAVCSGLASTPEAPADMRNLDYKKANAIEQILADIEITMGTWAYCGDAICGGV